MSEDQIIFPNLPIAIAIGGLLVAYYCIGHTSAHYSASVNAPYALTYLKYTPRWLSNSLYAWDAIGVVEKGYRKFNKEAFKLIRSDVNMVVLPAKHIPELSSLPIEVASGIKALERDLLGRWTGLHIIIHSRLHHKLVQRRLTPNLSLVIPGLEEEVTASLNACFPQSYEWTPIKPYYTLLEVSARVSSRVLVGYPMCQDPTWIDISKNFTENIFESIVIMRCFPPWLYSTLGYLLPSVWRTKGYIKKAQDLLSPAFAERLKAIDEGTYKPSGSQVDGFTWLAELAEGSERDPTKLAHYEILLALASIHTTLLREVNVLYDVMAEPQYIDMLREEIKEVAQKGWDKTAYGSLEKLDSVLRESQRLSPPQSIGLRRIMQQSHVMSDGTVLPKGSYVCVAAYAIENDPANTRNPEKFDGLRDYDKRRNTPGTTKYQFTSTEPNVLGFGNGKTACPGRFFASLALKAVLVKLLSEYDFMYKDGKKEKPQNILVHEFVFPNRSNEILVRKRKGHEAPF
ncbi:cytochrome P450 [Pleomassaria siparia CBS 279.74]|uniref:Cytochrome P450 n=1 Tax=Pleomassaria siparia CBS 279.74 TaxID=1314801 RepID=A0A6G1JZS9_9PLEO|nr:cytochrome P450 [Pleomassaria siparia CBS 279.74]